MQGAASHLPDDIDTLKRLVLEREAERATARQTTLHLSAWIEKLKLEIARLKRMQFGRSSERLGERIDQLELISRIWRRARRRRARTQRLPRSVRRCASRCRRICHARRCATNPSRTARTAARR